MSLEIIRYHFSKLACSNHLLHYVIVERLWRRDWENVILTPVYNEGQGGTASPNISPRLYTEALKTIIFVISEYLNRDVAHGSPYLVLQR